MDKDKKGVPSDEGKTQEQTSGGADPGSVKDSKALLDIPEHLQGKSVEELTKMYRNLEKKLGEQSSEVEKARKTSAEAEELKKNTEVLLGAIWADPERYQTTQKWITHYLGGETQGKTDSSESSGEAKTGVQSESPKKTDDTRRALQLQILGDFYKRHGIDQLPDEERKAEQKKIGDAFAELADPGGTKPITKVLDEVSLDRLPKYLESAYLMANRERITKELGQKGLLTAWENRQASIGSLTSSSKGESGKTTITAEERAVAEKLGVKPEDYAREKGVIGRKP